MAAKVIGPKFHFDPEKFSTVEIRAAAEKVRRTPGRVEPVPIPIKLTRAQVKKLAFKLVRSSRKTHPCKVTTRIHAERWSSDEARHEVHFFIRGTQEYIAGFNPKYIEEFKIVELLRLMAFEVD